MRRWLGLALLSAWMAMPTSAGALDMERLCGSDLPAGATCVASEPLQETQSPVTSNPPNSVTKSMGGSLDLTGTWSYEVQSSKPSTSITPLRALRGTGNVGTSKLGWYPSSIPLPASGSACARHMMLFSADSVGNEAGERKKFQDFYDINVTVAGNPINQKGLMQLQTQATKSTAGGPPPTDASEFFMDQMILTATAPASFSCSTNAATGTPVTIADCKGSQRCETQICIHGDFATGNDIWWEFLHRVVDANGQVSKTRRKTSNPCDLGGAVTLTNNNYAPPSGDANETNLVINAYNGQNCYSGNCAECGCIADDLGTATNYSAIGWRESNFAAFFTSTDTNFTIPLPLEIVGDGGLGSPGQPAFMPWRVAP